LKFYRHVIGPALLALAFVAVSCRTVQLPPADFSRPGWQVHEGQAVWRPTRKRPELAGDLLLATNTEGDFFIRFAKTPFTLATAREQAGAWQIDFGGGMHVFSGHGSPPRRFAWFQLPGALDGRKPPPPWKFTALPDDSWRLENPHTGESLEGYLP
jgi:hypothetical protein